MPFPILAGLAAGAAAGYIGSKLQKENNAASMADSYQYGQKAQINAATNQRQGLLKAGLSPSLMSTTQFNPASSPSALPSGMPSFNVPDFVQMASVEQNQLLVEAQSNLIDAQTKHQELINTRIRDEDYTFDAQIRGQLNVWADDDSNPERAAAAQLMLDSNDIYTKGTADSLRTWNMMNSENDAAKTDAAINEFVRQVYSLKKQGNNARFVAGLDEAQLRKIGAETFHLLSAASEASTAADVNVKRLDEIEAHISQMLENKDSMYYNNPAKMYKLKDRVGFFGYAATQAIKAISAGAGFAVGAKGAGAAGRLASGRMAPTAKKGFDAIFKTGFEGKKLQKKASPLSALSQSEQNRRILSYY